MTKDGSPMILLAIYNGAGGAEDFYQRNYAQGNEYGPNDFVSFEYFGEEAGVGGEVGGWRCGNLSIIMFHLQIYLVNFEKCLVETGHALSLL